MPPPTQNYAPLSTCQIGQNLPENNDAESCTLSTNADERLESKPEKQVTHTPRTKLNKEQLLDRRERIWELRVTTRLSMREIATQMGVSVFTVHSDLKKVQQHRTAELDKRREEVAVKQDAIYESLLDKWIPVALAEQGDVEEQLYATDRVARILADQAKLHGYTVTARDTAAAKQAGHELGMTVLQAMAALAGGSRVVQAEVITQPRIEDGKRD